MDTNNALRLKFATNLKHYMKREKKTQADITRDLGFASSLISEWVKGKKYPRIERLNMLADYLHVSVGELVDTVDDKFYTLPFYHSDAHTVNEHSSYQISSYHDAFLFLIKNNEMHPTLKLNDLVVAEKKNAFLQDCLVIANINNHLSAYMYHYDSATIETYKPQKTYSIKDKNITLIAQIVELRRKF